MPLPEAFSPWPPKASLAIGDQYDVWSAWYGGDPGALQRAYGADGQLASWGQNRAARSFFLPDNPRLRNFIARWFWGSPVPVGEQRSKLHIPVAADIAAISADLLYAEPPTLSLPDGNTASAEQVEAYVEDGLWTSMREAAEQGAAMGGVYLRVVWDDQVRDRPWLVAAPPDRGVPEWRWDQLAAATFWRVIDSDDPRHVVRHLERHEPGVILHGVYVGTKDDLGQRAPLTEFDETRDLAGSLTDGDMIATDVPMLTAGYIPNMRPNRIWRGVPSAANLGRSDYSGVEGLFDALDETWSSWLRDVRLAKARLVVPQQSLLSLGKGKGATWSTEQEILTGLDIGPNPAQQKPEMVQFAIRMEEHRATASELLEQAVRDAGYSMQTLSGTGDVAMTATEVASRERRSLLTRGRKLQYHGPVLRDMLEALLAVDQAKFGPDGVQPSTPHVDWPKWVFVDPMDTASTIQILRDAQVVSLETSLRMLHPDWDDDQIQQERARIVTDQAGSVDLGGGMGLPVPASDTTSQDQTALDGTDQQGE